jgi:hypothetical protein
MHRHGQGGVVVRQRQAQWVLCALAAAWGAWVCAHTYTHADAWHAPLLDYPISQFPFWREAVVRAVRAVAGAAAIGVAAWQLGEWITSRSIGLFTATAERLQFTLACGAVALSSLLLLAASFGVYRPPVVTALILVVVASRLRPVLRQLRRHAWLAAEWLRGTLARPASGVYAAFAFLALAFAFVAALAPETEYDALWYHLWLPSQWLAAGRLVDIVPEYISLYPGGWELLNGAAATFGGPTAAKLLHFTCLPLLGAAACLLAREVGARVSMAAVAAICICAPTMMWEASTAYVDLALAWFTTLSTIALIRYYDTADMRWLLLGGLMAGGALGIKHLGLVALAAQVALLVVAQWRTRAAVVASVRDAAVLFILAIGLAMPWYGRAYAASGNPVFPDMYELFGARPAERWSPGTEAALQGFKDYFGMGRDAAAIVQLPWNVTTHAARFGGTFGPAFLVLAPFAIATRSRRLALLAAGVAIYVAIWASPVGSFQLRFLTPVIPAGAVFAAVGLRQISAAARDIGRPIVIGVHAATAFLLLLNLPPFIDWHERERRDDEFWLTHVLRPATLAVVTGGESEQSYLGRVLPSYRAWRAINDGTPQDSRVLTFFGGDHLYSRRSRIWSDAWLAYDATWGSEAGHEASMLAALRRLGITHVLFDRRQLRGSDVPRLAIASDAARACCLTPFYEDDRAVVFAVREAPAAAPRSAPAIVEH